MSCAALTVGATLTKLAGDTTSKAADRVPPTQLLVRQQNSQVAQIISRGSGHDRIAQRLKEWDKH